MLVAGPWNFPTAIPANGVARRARRRQRRDPQAGAGGRGHGRRARPPRPRGRRPRRRRAARALPRRRRRPPPRHPRRRRRRRAHRRATTRPGCSSSGGPTCTCSPRRAARTRSSISQTADVDLALRDLVRSAFGHAGQKCSAASPRHRRGAAARRPGVPATGSPTPCGRSASGRPTDLASVMGPLIPPPAGPLRRALTTLDRGERWLVEPRQLDDSGRLWSPGVGSACSPARGSTAPSASGRCSASSAPTTSTTRSRIQNAVAFGLTGGLHSLDEDEIDALARAGRGRQRLRQPPHDRAPSCGASRSAGGSARPSGAAPRPAGRATSPASSRSGARRRRPTGAAQASYERWWAERFGDGHRPLGPGVGAQHPALPAGRRRRRAGRRGDARRPTSSRCAPPPPSPACRSRSPTTTPAVLAALGHGSSGCAPSCRSPTTVLAACHDAGVAVDRTPVTHDGRVELPCWLREQAISWTVHRHGRLPR